MWVGLFGAKQFNLETLGFLILIQACSSTSQVTTGVGVEAFSMVIH